MIDLKHLRDSPDEVKANLARRGIELVDIDRALELDAEIRQLAATRDEHRSTLKKLAKQVGEALRNGNEEEAERLKVQEIGGYGQAETMASNRVIGLELELRELLLVIPNEISPEVPDGKTEADNPIRTHAKDREWAQYQRVAHWEIGKQLGILDNERAVKMSGSMFSMFRGAGATLSRALCQLALDRNADAWEEIRPPSLVKTETMISTGHLPKFEDDGYAVERDGLWTIPTAEVPLTSINRDEIMQEADLPQRMMAYTPCYRREAGSAGKDTRGVLRVHEFDKVEMMGYASPAQGEQLMFEILERSETLFSDLGFQYRIIEICAGDLSRSHRRSFDIEAYAPGTDAWLEVASVSWFGDYQARRANVRYKPVSGGSNEVVHTANGTALAVPRAWATLVETYRQPDGSVVVPDVLRPYMRGIEVIEPR